MLETYSLIFTNIIRNLKKNIKSSPILYFVFFIMISFSIAIIARLTWYFINYKISINLTDIFFVVFFIFLIKSSVDFYKYYINSKPIVYVFSLPILKIKPLFEIFLLIFWIQLGLWVFFSSIYHIFLYIYGINLSYPLIYLQFLLGIILSIIIGAIIPIHIYNKKKYRIIPVVFLLIILWFRTDIISILKVKDYSISSKHLPFLRL